MVKKILVAIDSFTDSSHRVYDQATILAQATQAQLRFLHVISIEAQNPIPKKVGTVTIRTPFEEPDRSLWKRFEDRCLRYLKAYADRAKNAGFVVDYKQIKGIPQETICEVAHQWDADMLILGYTEPGAIQTLSRYVLQKAPCPILFVRTAA
ncbi:MAG: universal stress protein [Cyanobacteria bacterium P01_G01_bin.38]